MALAVREEGILVVIDRPDLDVGDRDDPLLPVAATHLEGGGGAVGDGGQVAALLVGRRRRVAVVDLAGGAAAGGGGGGAGLGAAGEEDEGQNEALHAGVSNGGGPASRGAGLRQLPGNPGV